jgi:hypothetical protein
MSVPKSPPPQKLLIAVIYRDRAVLDQCLERLAPRFGPSDFSTRETPFRQTSVYNAEMGPSLFRRFFTYRDLAGPGELAAIKLFTNSLENQHLEEGRRLINLDPGLVCLKTLVLATGKNPGHRIYLGQGIHADLTLLFERGSYRPLPWTYPDYADPAMIDFLNRIREAYKLDLRELAREKGRDPEREDADDRAATDAEDLDDSVG